MMDNENLTRHGVIDFDHLHAELEQEFHAIANGDTRKGIRLEKVFWRSIEMLAAEKGMKPNEFVRELVAESQRINGNTASVVRTFVTSTLRNELEALRANGTETIKRIQKAPVPSFAIDRQKRLKQVNHEFLHVVRVLTGQMTMQVDAERIQLILETPIEELFAKLETQESSVDCGYLLRVGEQQRRGQARVICLPVFPEHCLIGFIKS
ncbi:putative DNA-binding ribbon-helix-helix protein [Maritalea mobilis]|uniref:Putative DNA-binding ribbon-helix-helix protein n=1 Tax=Maritalea mobilis TaxID=483324 RepID=A0A4R6VTQ2_9HYPH|nr:ribbon-helix-helix domain-containing protein [Maritalea mobilis]TDQ63551.1 putative DNA-binding ribbon-helix-helix protein [Maritalea mobilis]